MGKQTIYVCDYPGCGQMKKDTNHWILVRNHEDRIYFMWLEGNESLLEAPGDVKVMCSRECAQKVLEKFLGNTQPSLPVKGEPAFIEETIKRTYDEARKRASYLDNVENFHFTL